jgi:hypothetical protein
MRDLIDVAGGVFETVFSERPLGLVVAGKNEPAALSALERNL